MYVVLVDILRVGIFSNCIFSISYCEVVPLAFTLHFIVPATSPHSLFTVFFHVSSTFSCMSFPRPFHLPTSVLTYFYSFHFILIHLSFFFLSSFFFLFSIAITLLQFFLSYLAFFFIPSFPFLFSFNLLVSLFHLPFILFQILFSYSFRSLLPIFPSFPSPSSFPVLFDCPYFLLPPPPK